MAMDSRWQASRFVVSAVEGKEGDGEGREEMPRKAGDASTAPADTRLSPLARSLSLSLSARSLFMRRTSQKQRSIAT